MDAAELCFSGLSRQAGLMADGEVCARELVDACLERIERLDPQLNAFHAVYAEQARTQADQADSARRAGEHRPLLGVPVAIKEDADVAGEVTTYGSAGHGPPAREDSAVVARLRGAGAIVIGKTNVPELMIWPFTETETYGVTRNPWDVKRTPGGSSGGSAAAVAAGLVGGALGSDGGGSIRIPAACCGLFGLKPQRGRIPLAPQREQWHGLSVYGPLVRTVADAALFLDVTSGPLDGHGRPVAPARSFSSAAATPPGRLRVAVSARVAPGLIARVDRAARTALDETASLLRSLGHQVIYEDPSYAPMATAAFLARYLRGIHDDAASIAHPERLESRTRGMARLGALVTPRLLARARAAEAGHAARLDRLFERHDVLLTPALATSPPRVGRWEGKGALATFNGVASFVPFQAPFNHTGQPAAVVPAGLTRSGLPLSVQMVGRPGDEATLLSLAAQIEAERPWAQRRPPVS